MLPDPLQRGRGAGAHRRIARRREGAPGAQRHRSRCAAPERQHHQLPRDGGPGPLRHLKGSRGSKRPAMALPAPAGRPPGGLIMKRPRVAFTSVRQKFFAAVLLTSLVALLISGASLFLYDLHSYRESSSTDLSIEAQIMGHATTAALQFDDRAVAAQNLAFLKARPNIRVGAIYNPRGALFASYVRPGAAKAEIPTLPGSEGIAIRGDRIQVFRRIVADNEIVGTVYLAQDLELYKRIGSYTAIALVVIVAALGVSALLSRWLQSGITGPIVEVATLAREVVEKRDYTVRANRTTGDEIGTLVDASNEMLSDVQRRTTTLESSNAEVGRLNNDLERPVRGR